jgi:alpha-ketoglutarate-dependent taurine dioxygenase
MHIEACKPPNGLQPYLGPATWLGKDLENDESWIRVFTLAEIEEIETAMRAVQKNNTPLAQIGREQFPLPSLEATFEHIQKDLEGGRGFVLLRGLPLRRYTLEEAQLIYWGLGTHIGQAVSQNADGEVIGHIRVVEAVLNDPHKRGYMKPNRASFHTDTCDVVGLMCWRKAKRGGESFVASAMTAHNLMLQERPDLLEELYEPYCHDIKNEQQPHQAPYYKLPVFSWKDGLVSTRYSRSRILTGQRFPEVPRLTDKQIEAFNYLDQVAEREDVALAMDFQVGDIQLVNNYVCLHSRNAYQDYHLETEKRHLLRLWLAQHNGRELPDSFLDVYHGNIAPNTARGGIPPLL